MANWSGLWNGLASGTVASENYSIQTKRSPNRYHLARIMRKRNMQELAEVMSELTGSAAGQSASKLYSRVTAAADTNSNVQGGSRAVESKEMVGLLLDSDIDDASANTARITSATDLATINEVLLSTGEGLRAPTTYPVDDSGKKNIHGESI